MATAVGDSTGSTPADSVDRVLSDELAQSPPATAETGPKHASEAGEDEEDEEEREPTLKYTKLTSHLGSVYRNGDSTSTSQVSADKLIIGTHNGVIHVHTVPSLQSLRQYRAHSSSVTAISISPFSPSYIATSSEDKQRTASNLYLTPKKDSSGNANASASPKSPRPPVPATPTNSIYIATASIDGHVCVSSLVDSKDVTLRNYSRPVHAVSLSPTFKNDRTYLSGGTAGNLICTVGGKAGVSSDASTNSAAAAASGWLGSIGLGSNTGKDTILHSGEGTITSINWSMTGKYVAWTNEYGTRIMRSQIDVVDTDHIWKRIGHVPKPNRSAWEDMAGVWKARTQWIDPLCLEEMVADVATTNGAHKAAPTTPDKTSAQPSTPGTGPIRIAKKHVERLLIGWGDTCWVIHVHGTPATTRSSNIARAEIMHQFSFEDGIVSGLTLYSPSILVALVFRTIDDDEQPIAVTDNEGNTRRGRRNGLPPDIRLIDLSSPDKDEIDNESVVMSRFERLSFADYQLSTLYMPSAKNSQATQTPKGALEMIGGGLYDVGMSTTRLFSSGASVLSGSSSGDRTPASPGQSNLVMTPSREVARDAPKTLLNSGLKIVITSPFDCVLAIKRDLSDRLSWEMEHEQYESAWNLVRNHPEVIVPLVGQESKPSTPTRSHHSLADFFDDTSSQSTKAVDKTDGSTRVQHAAVEEELQRIGDLWIQKLVKASSWAEAGAVAGKSLRSTRKWEDWIQVFTQNGKFDEITPYVPTHQLKPPLPSYIYEVILAHYATHDRIRLEDLLAQWDPTLFDPAAVATHIESYIEQGEVGPNMNQDGVKGRDWRILMDCLAKLYLADARPSEAIHCYLKTKNADAVLEVVREYAKIDAVSDNVWDFVRLDMAPGQIAAIGEHELDTLSSTPVNLLATAAVQGTVEPEDVIRQLQAKTPTSDPYLYLYFRQLWRPDDSQIVAGEGSSSGFVRRPRFSDAEAIETPSRALLGHFADAVVTSFAKYSQSLLNEFLKATNDYNFEHASEECRNRHYIPELVYLLNMIGQKNNALHLIIDELNDVSMAIAYVRETEDDSLWNDLLDYSMDKPDFIRGLLEDVGTSITPMTLVKRIPEGLTVTGLKNSLAKLLRESEISFSISDGASKVLSSEINIVLDQLRRRRERGVVFEVSSASRPAPDAGTQTSAPSSKRSKGTCMSCGIRYDESESEGPGTNDEYLIGFICGHIFHLTCLLDCIEDETNRAQIERLQKELSAEDRDASSASHSIPSVGNKIRHAQRIKGVVGNAGCLTCQSLKITNKTEEER